VAGSFFDPQPRGTVLAERPSRLVALSRDGTTLLTETCDEQSRDTRALFVWDTSTGQLRRSIDADWGHWPHFTVSPDAGFLAVSGQVADDIDSDVRLRVWDLGSGDERISLTLSSRNRFPYVTFSPDERFLVLFRDPGLVKGEYLEFWDLATGQARAKLNCNCHYPTFASDSRSFAIDEYVDEHRSKLMILDLNESEPFLRLIREQPLTDSSPSLSPDFRSFVTMEFSEGGDGPAEINLWDTETGIVRDQVPFAAAGTHDRSCGFGSDGRMLIGQASRPDGEVEVTVWDVGARLNRRATFVTRDPRSPDGRWCAKEDYPGAEVFETTSPERRTLLQASADSTMPSRPCVICGQIPRTSVTFAPDSKTLLVTGLYHDPGQVWESLRWRAWEIGLTKDPFTEDVSFPVARLWRLADGKQIAAFRGCETGLFSPDGSTLATLHDNGTIRIWHVPPHKPLVWVLGTAFALWLAILVAVRLGRLYLARRRASRPMPGVSAPRSS